MHKNEEFALVSRMEKCYNIKNTGKGWMTMCDTLGRLGKVYTFFAKNSDRSPNEVQLLEYHAPKQNLTGQVDCTYISIPQAEQTYGVLLSRPDWMWGAEMGVNEWGLCIGNEAVFTKGAYGKTGLTGMDMVRLALERSKSAEEALHLLVKLLETYGQGGNCGFDHNFYYDNAFLILDRDHLYVLQTAGKEWVYKAYTQTNISNRLSIGADGDGYSGGKVIDFCHKYTEPVFTTFSGSQARSRQMADCLPVADSVDGCFTALRSHKKGASPFSGGSVASACMHYGGMVGDHTTQSMVVSLEKERTVVWSTGCSLPCVSLFKPWIFGTEPVLPVTIPQDPAGKAYWLEAEIFRRSLLGKKVPDAFYAQRDAIQNRWLEKAASVSVEDFSAFSRECLREEQAFYDEWKNYPFETETCRPGFTGRWEKKNQALSTKV